MTKITRCALDCHAFVCLASQARNDKKIRGKRKKTLESSGDSCSDVVEDLAEGELEVVEVGVGEEAIDEKDANDVDHDRYDEVGGEFGEFFEGLFGWVEYEGDDSVKQSVEGAESHS